MPQLVWNQACTRLGQFHSLSCKFPPGKPNTDLCLPKEKLASCYRHCPVLEGPTCLCSPKSSLHEEDGQASDSGSANAMEPRGTLLCRAFLGRTDVLTLSRACWELSQLLANGLKAFLEPWGMLWGHWPILQDYIWYSSVAMTTKGRWHWGDRGRGEAAGHSFPKLVPRGEADGWPALCRNREPSPE